MDKAGKRSNSDSKYEKQDEGECSSSKISTKRASGGPDTSCPEKVPKHEYVVETKKRDFMRGNRRLPDVIRTRFTNAPTKQGFSGAPVQVTSNYFRLTRINSTSIFQYHVDIEPVVQDVRLTYALLRTQAAVLGPYIFDGLILFLNDRLKSEHVELSAKDARSGSLYTLTVRFVGSVDMCTEKALMFLNLMQRQAMQSLKLLRLKRHFFDAESKISVPNYGLDIYPGYITSIRQHERELMMCVEISHRIVRTNTCYQMMQHIQHQPGSFKDNFKLAVIGSVVMSTYNEKTYRVTDVDFQMTPSCSFTKKDGQSITFMKYFQDTYNITIRDPNQPMLVSNPTQRQQRSGITGFLLLVPELSRMTGITEDMRRDFALMRSIADHTRIPPDKRILRLQRFNERLRQTPASKEVFQFWKTELDRHLVNIPGRTLSPEIIVFGTNRTGISAGGQAEWNMAFRNTQLYEAVKLVHWYVVSEGSTMRMASDFLSMMASVASKMDFHIAAPQMITSSSDTIAAYTKATRDLVNHDPQLILFVVRNDRADRYSAVKKLTCVDHAIPTQVLKARTITPKGGNVRSLMSVATKVAIQLNCKLGGIPWMVKNPLSSVMVVGFDVCHDAHDKSKSYGALVATMYAPKHPNPRFYSSVEHHHRGEELSDFISTSIVKALRSYQRQYGTDALPRRIILYRDGVGDGQLAHVVEHEVRAINERLQAVYSNNQEYEARLSVIVVTKRINSRLFIGSRNPPPGTVIDDTITLPERTDFFLISQTVRQGTVSPTAYNVIYDQSGLSIDQLQLYTYKQTHLYYNWSGSLSVPAVCQYAQKLAFLTSHYLHQTPNQMLENFLYYL